MSDENGDEIQKHLKEFLQKYSPYVKTEAGILRFDVAAYIPNGCYIGLERNQKVMCREKFKRNHCDLKWEALKDECEQIPKEERDILKQPIYEQLLKERMLKYGDSEYNKTNAEYEANRMTPYHRLGDMVFTDNYVGNNKLNSLWGTMHETCLCDDDAECPTAMECRVRQLDAEKRYGNYYGLHLFEVKSDKDTFTRLAHQIPLMTFFADYIWLVLGETQPIPEWLPLYVGVLRFVPPDRFKVERKGVVSIADNTAMKNQGYQTVLSKYVLSDHGYLPFAFQELLTLYKKWLVNSLFRWDRENHEVIMDMSDELKILSEWAKSCESQKS